MKKGIIILIAAIVVIGIWFMGGYNSMVSSEEKVEAAWSQVENVYQRRMDLIPNLVATVKGYAEHESETFENVINARSKATQVTVSPENLSPEELSQFNKAQGEISSALGRLMMITENYPDLKANQNFSELQAQLEGTENRITTERMKFNECAKEYNTLIRKFPRSIIASVFGFERKGYFEAQEGAQNAPVVEF
ncbi:MAG: LemA family protein [Bacteroidales bacterium]|nr:LemA family protein [Bacteroidales bacterium]